jgi:hypothetical protein
LKINIGRRRFITFGLSVLVPISWGAEKLLEKNSAKEFLAEQKLSSVNNARLGINLAEISGWNSELPFVDLFHMSRKWISQRDKSAWGTGPLLELDESGWVKRLEENCYVTTFASTSKGHYPKGDYVLLYDGEGEFEFATGKVQEKSPGRIVVRINENKANLSISIVNTNPLNYIKNIRFIMPGFESAYATNQWHPDFLKRWSGTACLRFMDFMATNNSTQVKWSDRPKVSDANYAKKGVPLELLIDLANRLNIDPWFCIPHLADDDYVMQFARMVKDQLNPKLRAWLEYSNEVWNGGFKQNNYAAKQGQYLQLSEKPWEAAWKFNAYRSSQIFKIWKQVFGGNERFVRVLASQAANDYVAQQFLGFKNVGKEADVLAIAPYMSINVNPKKNNELTENLVSEWSLDELFAYLSSRSFVDSTSWIERNKKVADQYGLKLVAYEAGQHLVGIRGAENNKKIESLFKQANADKRMGELYTKYLEAWTSLGGDLICLFNSVSSWSKWGSWGLLQYYDDAPASSPKYMAAIQWAKSRGQTIDYK